MEFKSLEMLEARQGALLNFAAFDPSISPTPELFKAPILYNLTTSRDDHHIPNSPSQSHIKAKTLPDCPNDFMQPSSPVPSNR